ncbi:hypothetical protein AB1Y20_014802 [Prymnesium parvum]|uniref:Uncharacterized protein n=1 Tax=Prymnesium parvum TaxID=97485 RepID=A0AB34IBR8_PRYPA
MPRLPGLRQAWSQRLVEAADAAETRHTLQVDDDAVTPSSAQPESTTAPTAHATCARKRRCPSSAPSPPTRRRSHQPYLYGRCCSPQTDPPGWELALYALILLGVDVPGAGESTDDQLVMRLVFPEKELGLCGARISSGRQAAAECLGLLIQTLRHLAVSHAAVLEQHKTLLTSDNRK